MKLDNKLKQKIDTYFAEISAEDLYHILTKKYNFIEENKIIISKGKYKNINITLSNVYRENISYLEYSIEQNIESVIAKPIKDISNSIQETKISSHNESSIPLAA